jgi:hypothetical protein
MKLLPPTLTADRLRELLNYDSATGVFTWRVDGAGPFVKAGAVAGGFSDEGYRRIGIDMRLHKEHRLAWLYVHGVWPSKMIDHINGDRADNRMANLRDTSPSVNLQNIYLPTSLNKTGFRGVRRLAGQRPRPWQAVIHIPGERQRSLGTFTTPEEASAAYMAAKARLHPGAVPERIALASSPLNSKRSGS